MASVSTKPAQCDWDLYAGDRNDVLFEFKAGTTPWDLTGAVVTAQARTEDIDANEALTATCTITNALAGQVVIEWDGEDVRTLLGTEKTWTGEWDVQVKPSGQTLPVTVLRGKITAQMDVTRAVVG